MDNKICNIHNEPTLYFEVAQQKIELQCKFCVQQNLQTQITDDVDNEQKLALKQLELKYDQGLNQLGNFNEILENYTQLILKQIKKIQEQVEQNISQIIEKKNQIKNKYKDFTDFKLNQINEEENLINIQFSQIKYQLNNELKELEISNKLDQLFQLLNNLSIDVNNKENEQVQSQQIAVIDKPFEYQLIEQQLYEQKESCLAIAFNKDNSIMIACFNESIKVFEFQGEKLREVQKLEGHSNTVNGLWFMKKSNQFISTSYDQTIKIWEQHTNNQWQSNQTLKGHYYQIQCILLNENEDMLISGSHDKTIRFWQKQNNSWSFNQYVNCESEVNSISLSNFDDKLIASVRDFQILVIQLQGNMWEIQQRLTVQIYGYRLCLISQYQFVFQPYDSQYLLIFDYDQKDQIFKQGQKLEYSNLASDSISLFPIRYISQIGLIMVKHGNKLFLIKKSQNGEFAIEQSIYFDTQSIFGCVSNDGRYIATWDCNSKEIQIRKFEY